MNYTFHQLKVFMAVVEKKSITKAAFELHMTQPAVSIQLKNLQDQFDIPLTEIIGRQLYVTEFGNELYTIAEKILEEVAAINYKTQIFKGMLSGKLKISVASTGKYVMPYYLKDFLKINANIDLLMDVTNKAKVIESLEGNAVDFALVSVLPEKLEIEQEILLPNNLVLIAATEQTLGANTPLTKTVFDDLPLIYREEGSGTRAVMQQYFKRLNIVPKVRFELTSSEAVKQAVMAGLGFSIQPVLSIKNELKQKAIQIIPVEGLPLIESWRLIWLKNKKMSVVAREFLKHVQLQKQEIYKSHFSWIEDV
jgi:DNA-binding transcriptional LysR family regulator